MRILVTNDDGIDAPGLLVLARAAVDAGHEVVIAAPARQSSGTSASIVAEEEDGRVAIDQRRFREIPDVSAFAVGGGPGLIAMLAARRAFGEPADLVLSGVNHGANVGRAILHSGTVGAALTGGLNGAWGIAVSLDVGFHPEQFFWGAGAAAAVALIEPLASTPRGTVVNVNAPNAAQSRGMVEARLAPFGIVQSTLMADEDEHHVRLAVEDLPNSPEPGTDAALLAAGWTTVTRIEPIAEHPLPFRLQGPQATAASASDALD